MTEVLRAVRESALTAPQRHVAMTIASLSNPTTGAIPEAYQPNRDDLVRYTGLSRATISRVLREIEEQGWIQRPRLSERVSRIVAVLIPDKAHSELSGEHTKAHSEPSNAGGVSTLRLTVRPLRLTVSHAKAHSEIDTVLHGPYGPTGLTSTVTPQTTDPNTIVAPDTADAIVDAVLVETDNALFEVDPPNPPTPTGPNAGRLLKEWIDYTTAQNVTLTKRLIGQYAKTIKTILDQGIDENTVKRALALMLAEGVASNPSYLDNFVVRAQQGPTRRPRRLTPGEESVARLTAGNPAVADKLNHFFDDREVS